MGLCVLSSRYLLVGRAWVGQLRGGGGLVLYLELLGLGTKCVREWKAKLRFHAALDR